MKAKSNLYFQRVYLKPDLEVDIKVGGDESGVEIDLMRTDERGRPEALCISLSGDMARTLGEKLIERSALCRRKESA